MYKVSGGPRECEATKHLDLALGIGVGGSEQAGQVGLGTFPGVKIGLVLETLLRSGSERQKGISKFFRKGEKTTDSPADADLRLLAGLRLALTFGRCPLDDKALFAKSIDELSGGRRIDGYGKVSTVDRCTKTRAYRDGH